ncbi:hypothetical protein NA57DRAFT_61989 [Rhizodiscina lignyota]|uniref:Protein PNS1 n=1 Tax=Rhizodiscina lignyota TaxID=1504668 RepID=A0A9P4I0U0_9PEZI|nr:hypothetical protein NA57DRAFT_61989 [Rhizodiscina lignyota]
MFSEYASKFLAQSGSTLSMGFADRNPLSRNPQNRQQRPTAGTSRYQTSRSYLQRPGMQNPYQQGGSQLGRFGFGSRTSAAPAPLFHSTLDDFREEDDVEEHERDVAEYYALQRSRRQVGASQLTESSEGDDDAGRSSPTHDSPEAEEYRRGRGIRSSWRGESTNQNLKPPTVGMVKESPSREREGSDSSKGKGKLVEVELASRASEESMEKVDVSEDLDAQEDDDPPAYQQFRKPPSTSIPAQHTWMPRETDEETAFANPRPPSPDRESVPGIVPGDQSRTPRHDIFWSHLFFLLLAALFGSFLLSFLHNSEPDKKHPLGDSIYSTLRASFHLLGVDTLVTIIVAVLWLAVLRSALRPLVYLILVAVPIILMSFAIYPFVASFKGYWVGTSIQDRLMRFTSFIPAAMAVFWIIMNIRSRHAISRAVDILDFSARILESSPSLVLVGFGTLVLNVFWLWTWILMFRRLFLGGHYSSRGGSMLFIVDLGTWWLGAFFIVMYLWTQAIIAGVQRATTAATVSQWYFHRNAVPAPTSRAVVQESFKHATSTLFGTVCASTLCQLAVRLPLLLLPRRFVGIVSICMYNIFPTPIASLTNPLTLTYAAIHSQPLAQAARGLSSLSFVSAMSPTTTLTPASASDRSAPLLPYRLAKLLLHATRYVTSLALGIAGWVSTSHSLKLAGNAGIKGSLYAYIVGIVAGFIGWSILGATEAVMGGIVDAVAVCWGTECAARDGKQGRGGDARAGYCWEAAELFGEGTSVRR